CLLLVASPPRRASADRLTLPAPHFPLGARLSPASPGSTAPLPHIAVSTYSYAPMSHCAPLMPSPSSGRTTPSASVAVPEVPASMATLVLCRRRFVGALTYSGFAEIRLLVVALLPARLFDEDAEFPQRSLYVTSSVDADPLL